jgi:hypothetical protein
VFRQRFEGSHIFWSCATVAALLVGWSVARADDFQASRPFRQPQPEIAAQAPRAPASARVEVADDVTSGSTVEAQAGSPVMFRVGYRRGGAAETRIFLIPRELALGMGGGLNASVGVGSLILGANGEPRQLILKESGEKNREVEFQIGWNEKGGCQMVAQGSQGGVQVGEAETADCKHYLYNPARK